MVLAGLNSGDFLSFPPKGLSLRWVIAFLQSEKYLSSFFSFPIGFDDDGHLHGPGTMAALYLSRQTRIWRGVLQSFFSPVVLPGVVVGFSIYAFFISTEFPLVRTIWGLWWGTFFIQLLM